MTCGIRVFADVKPVKDTEMESSGFRVDTKSHDLLVSL